MPKNNGEGRYDFKIHRKDAITNVQTKPHSSINPKIVPGIFKGFSVCARRICSEKYLIEEINFLIDMFVENGHVHSDLEKIAEPFRRIQQEQLTKAPSYERTSIITLAEEQSSRSVPSHM